MEDLTKTQIVLLTLLVSFVTSIATGIITTSLLSQAPQSVTQTINRVVENTIEKVSAPISGGSIIKEVTVIKEDDAVINSIDKVSPALVRISVRGGDGGLSFYALGVIINNSGLVLSARSGLIIGAPYSVTLADGTVLGASLAYQSDIENIVLFKIAPDEAHKNKFPVTVLATNDLKLGQTIILVSGRDKNHVYIDRVISLNASTAETSIPSSVEISGAPIINLSGELTGIKSPGADTTFTAGVYTTLSPIKQLINKAK